MPISLHSAFNRLSNDINILGFAFTRLTSGYYKLRTVDRFAIQEGLISQLWQSWCNFSRETILVSAQGGLTANNAVIGSTFSQNSVQEICFAAKKISQNQAVGTIKAISGSHQEPTWGDLGKINAIVTGLSPSNLATLTSAFGLAIFIADLQLCRNACAHLTKDRLADIVAIRTNYDQSKFTHPSDMIRWIDPITNDYLWLVWMDEMKVVALKAIQ